MKWVLLVTGILVVFIVLIYVVGLLLPVRHSVAVREVIPVSPERLWERLTNVSGFPQWRKSITRVDVLNDSEWVEVSGHNSIPMKIKEIDSLRRVICAINSKSLPFGGEWVYELHPQGNTTLLTITENGEVYNPFFRFISRFMMGYTTTLNKYFADLQGSFH